MSHPNDKHYIQYLVAFSGMFWSHFDALSSQRHLFRSGGLSMFASSASFAWVSPMIPLLKQPESPIPITSDEGGWLVFAIMIGRIAGVIPGAWAMDR